MNNPYPVKIPQSLQLTIPFTIKPDSLLGVHLKYWSIPYVLVLISIIFTGFLLPAYALYLLIPVIGSVGFVIWTVRSSRMNSLSLTAESLVLVKNGVTQTISMTDLALVEWGLTFAGSRLYYTLFIKNINGEIEWKLSVLNGWNTRALRTVYTSVPVQHQGRQDVQPF
ncbi:hypothetical protein H7200_02360 [Candidatus Saccharibacteria bacterium]|nr:hypothetical protein [Candidatus Saccharibacteria bacterium]